MDTERWNLAGNIFERLLGAPVAERTVLLDDLCGEDAELKRIVESMLDSENSAQRFEDRLRAGVARHAAAGETTSAIATDHEEPQVGPWRLVRKLGSGGMGVVWLAERADGQFEQRSALKLIKRGMDSDAVLKRFLRERQILARLDHPNIAHLLDGGIATDGRPYFAMEYVEGSPLLRWCHERNTKLEERLDLFQAVCAAVQFAHEHHVVHRDLKPSNIHVTANGSVKLLDFGIAKLLDIDESGADAITHLQRERPMTPAYAAPEQIRGDRITEATDIYALGCVLYELLTGRRAHDFSGAHEPRDVLRIIEASDPVAPSRAKLAEAPITQRRLRGDLDTIVLTALRREPARRYATAAALAADLKAYLTGKPISARRDSVFYRAWKYTRRHYVGLASSIALLAMAAAIVQYEIRDRFVPAPVADGNALAIVDFNNLSQQADNAWLSPALAEMLATELTSGSKVHVLPDELVRSARRGLATPLAGGYAMQSLATLRKRLGAEYVLSGSYLVSGSPGEPKLRVDLALQDTRSGAARASVTQSGALADLSALIEQAGASLREKSGFAPAVLSAEQNTDRAQPPNTEVARHMGLALDALRKFDPARAKDELLEAIALAPGYAPAYLYLSQAWKALGYDGKALASAQQAAARADKLPPVQRLQIERQVAVQRARWDDALKADEKLLSGDVRNPEFHLTLIDDFLSAGKTDAAEEALEKMRAQTGSNDPRLELNAARIGQIRGDPKAQAEHAQRALEEARKRDELGMSAQAKRMLGIALNKLGERDRAERLLRESIADFARTANPKGEAGARTSLANVFTSKNQPEAAAEEYERALAVFQRVGDQNGLSAIYGNMVILLWDRGDRDGAETAARRALEIRREIGDVAGEAWVLLVLAQIQLDESAGDSTLETYRQAIALDERAGQRAHHFAALQKYSEALQLRGDLDGAHKACAQAEDEARSSTDPMNLIQAELRCGAVALDRGEMDDFAAAMKRVTDLAREQGDSEQPAYAELLLARVDIATKDYSAAVPRLRAAIQFFSDGEVAASEAEAQSLVAICHAALGQTDLRDRASARARELLSANTIRGAAAVVNLELARLLAFAGDRKQAVARLNELARDARARQWVALELEARLAAVLAMDASDPQAAKARSELELDAHRLGFGWVSSRLANASKP